MADGKDEKPRIIFLRGRKVILRPMRKSTDLEKCLVWFNDPEVTHYLLRSWPIMEQEEELWFDGLKKKDNDIVLAIETLDGVFIGTMGLCGISWKDGTATTGAAIGEKSYWGKGYGTDAKMALLDYAFNVLNLRKICSTVTAYNKRSIQYNRHCGYKVEGVRRRHIFKNGRYHDEVLLAVFKKDWLPIWKGYRKTGKVK